MSNPNVDPVRYLICGGVGGVCTVVAGHSLDTIKVRLQTMPKPEPGQLPKYSGTFDCFRKIVAQEGFLGLYKGVSAPLVSVAPSFGLSFFSFGIGKRVQQRSPTDELALHQFFLAGAFSGLCCTIVMAPVERIKCLLQTQSQTDGKPKYQGVLGTGYKLYQEGGVRSLYKGTVATILRGMFIYCI